MRKTALVLGAGGFIGSHMARRLLNDGYLVCGADLKRPEFAPSACLQFLTCDLATEAGMRDALGLGKFHEIYQFAADMGGAGYIFTGDNDAAVMTNSGLINQLLVRAAFSRQLKARIFYSSSACVYPAQLQDRPESPDCEEATAYPANPDSEYGWEKLFSERLYEAHMRNYGLDIRIARFHNIFGPEGTYQGGREKAPAAICRKVAEAKDGGTIEIWGDGKQTRSFLYIDECVEAVRRLMNHPVYPGVINIGSEERRPIRWLAGNIIFMSGKNLKVECIPGPQGVRGRNSHNAKIRATLGWAPEMPLYRGLEITYQWVNAQVNK